MTNITQQCSPFVSTASALILHKKTPPSKERKLCELEKSFVGAACVLLMLLLGVSCSARAQPLGGAVYTPKKKTTFHLITKAAADDAFT